MFSIIIQCMCLFATFMCIYIFLDKMCECYSAVSEWQELEAWYNHVNTLQGQASSSNSTSGVGGGGVPDTSSAFTIHYDINQLRLGYCTVAIVHTHTHLYTIYTYVVVNSVFQSFEQF